MEKTNRLQKRAIDLTAGELVELIAERLSAQSTQPTRRLKGIPGIMEIFQCGRSKAVQIRASGDIDEAITTNGRLFWIDENKALELMKNRKKR